MDSDLLTEPELSGLYHAFRAPRRRLVIQLLSKQPTEQLTTRFLARRITCIEQDVPREQATGEPYRNVYNALSQTHLPTLADPGFIRYESGRQRVAPGPNFGDAVLLLTINTATLETFRRIRMHNS